MAKKKPSSRRFQASATTPKPPRVKRSRQTKPEASQTRDDRPPFQIASGFWRRSWLPGLLIFVLAAALYSGTATYEFVLDDTIVIKENNFTQKGLAGVWEILSTESFTGFLGKQPDLVVGARYRPLSIAMFAAEYEIFGLKPLGYHVINILLYALSGLLLFRLLAMMLPPGEKSRWWLSIPFIGALLFALHPVHSEVVANIKGRDEILALLLALGSLYFSLRFAADKKLLWLLASGIVLFLAIMAKENAITFVAVIPFALYFFTSSTKNDLIKSTVPLLAAAVVYLIIRFQVVGYILDPGKGGQTLLNNPFLDATTGQKYATIFYTLGLYVKLLFFPHPLTHDYYPYHIPLVGWGDPRAFLSLLLYMAMGFFAFRGLKNRTVPAFSILFYIATLSIVSNLVFPVGAFMNERFIYMPSVAFCLLMGFWLARSLPELLANRPALAKAIPLGIFAIFALGFTYQTVTRLPDWKDEHALNRAAIRVSTGSARANCFMGVSLYRQSIEEQDQEKKRQMLEEALPLLNEALRIYPTYLDALTTKGGVIAGLYKFDNDLPRLLEGFFEIIRIREVPYIHEYLVYLNRRGQNQEILIDFYHRVGYEWYLEQKRTSPLALKYLNYGYELDPGNPQILEDLSAVYYKRKEYDKAIEFARKGMSRGSDRAGMYYWQGLAFRAQGDEANARALLERAQAMDPSLNP